MGRGTAFVLSTAVSGLNRRRDPIGRYGTFERVSRNRTTFTFLLLDKYPHILRDNELDGTVTLQTHCRHPLLFLLHSCGIRGSVSGCCAVVVHYAMLLLLNENRIDYDCWRRAYNNGMD